MRPTTKQHNNHELIECFYPKISICLSLGHLGAIIYAIMVARHKAHSSLIKRNRSQFHLPQLRSSPKPPFIPRPRSSCRFLSRNEAPRRRVRKCKRERCTDDADTQTTHGQGEGRRLLPPAVSGIRKLPHSHAVVCRLGWAGHQKTTRKTYSEVMFSQPN